MATRSAHIFDIPRHSEGRASGSAKRLRASYRDSDPVQLPMRPSALHIVLAAIIGVSLGFAGLLVADEVSQIRLKPTPVVESAAPSWSINPEYNRAAVVSARGALARADQSAAVAPPASSPGVANASAAPQPERAAPIEPAPLPSFATPSTPAAGARNPELGSPSVAGKATPRAQKQNSDHDAALLDDRAEQAPAPRELGAGIPQGFDHNPY